MNRQFVIGLACFLGAFVVRGDQAGPTPADWARALGSPKHEVRERAEKELLLLKGKARGAVRQALASDDPEVRSRAQRIWRAVRWGIEDALVSDLTRLLAAYREGKSPSLRDFVPKCGTRAMGVAFVLFEEKDEAAHRLARNLLQTMVGPHNGLQLAAQANGDEGVVRMLAGAGAYLNQDGSQKVLMALNLLWRHEEAAAVGLRALQRWPDDQMLVAGTMLAVRAGGNAEEIWGWLGRRRPNRAQLLLLAHLADAFGEAERLVAQVDQGVPEGLKEEDFVFLADYLVREDYPKTAVNLLAKADLAKLHYRRSRILASIGDRQGAEAAWQVVLPKLTKPTDIYTLADQMAKDGDPRAEEVWRKLLGDGKSKDVYASNACFRLAPICEGHGDYAEAADLYQAGLDRMQGAIIMSVNGKVISQDQAKERIRKTIRELRAKCGGKTGAPPGRHPERCPRQGEIEKRK